VSRSFLGLGLFACLALLPAGCDRAFPEREVPSPRLVVFAPGLTSILFDMGLGAHVVGVDAYSRTPPGEARPVVGSAMSVRVEPILAVRPDVVLVNLDPSQFEPILRFDPHVRIEHFDLFVLEDIARAMERIGRITEKPEVGQGAAASFRDKLRRVRERTAALPRVRVMFVVGHDPPFGPGREDFVDELIAVAGGENVLASAQRGWKRVAVESVIALDPRVIVCQADPGREATSRSYWEAIEVPGGGAPRRIVIVADPRWTQPSGYLADLASTLAEIIHPASTAGAPGS
jgi:ABC-type hemin transport system substrate-binding protein